MTAAMLERRWYVIALAALLPALLVAAILSWRSWSDTGSMGPPPRERLSRPVLIEVDERLQLVKSSASDVRCLPFLRAAYAAVMIFDLIPGMGMVQADIQGNADNIWLKMSSAGDSLLQLCDGEIAALGGDVDRARQLDGSVCTSLLWLKRALRLIEGILRQLMRHPSKTLRECCNAAYAASLRAHHNFIMRSAFAAALHASPSRADFTRKLAVAPEASETATLKAVGRVLASLTRPLDLIDRLLVERRVER